MNHTKGFVRERRRSLNVLTILDRGYTGHEHLQSVGLIDMNARLYDPKLHRFLQPDNYVQELFNTQNYNRYGYVLNNPLKYTDVSGDLFGWDTLLFAVVGGIVNWGMHGFQLNSQGALAFGIGAVGGAMLSMGNVAGLSFFQAGTLAMSVSVMSTGFISTANHIAFGDPLMTSKEMLITAGVSFIGGGIFRAPRVPVSTVSELTPVGEVGIQAESTIAATTGPTTVAATAGKATLDTSKELATKANLGVQSFKNFEGEVKFTASIVDDGATAATKEVTNSVTKTESVLGHIFRDAEGHVNPSTVTSQNRYISLFENVANNPLNLNPNVLTNFQREAANFQGYSQIFRNGKQVWTQTFNGKIINAGINLIPK